LSSPNREETDEEDKRKTKKSVDFLKRRQQKAGREKDSYKERRSETITVSSAK